MKRFLHIIAVIIVAAAGCSKPTVDEPQAGLSLVEGQETTFDIDAKGEIIPINFKSNLDWHSEITTDSKDEWIKFIPSSGRGGEINGKAQVLKNKSDKSRTGTLTIISEDKTLNFSFCQKAGKSENNEGGDDTGNDGGDDGDGTGDNTGNGDDTDGDGDDNGDGDDGSGDGDDTGDNTGDQIPDDEMPDIPADETVSSISSLLTGGVGKTFPDNTFIMGYVISNTNLGNLTSKKNMYIQDETAGVMIRFTADHTYNYGDLLKIDVSGKSLENYNDAIQLNNVSHDKVTVESTGHTIPYKTVSMSDFLANRYESQYVALKNVQVCDSDMNKTWLENAAHTSINFEDGNGNTFVVFSSKYATYGAEKVPSGSGTLKGIASINNGKIQLIFSTPNDWADMTGNRFGEDSGDDSGDTPGQEAEPGQSGKFGWYELPKFNYTQSNSYMIDSNDSDLYYAHHICDGGEKGPGGKTARNYTVCFSAEHHCPVWVAAPRHSMYEGSTKRTDAYTQDPKIPSDIQYVRKDADSGCNNGHMLGSAERTSSTNTNKQVFYFSNIAPQYSDTFNTGGGAWNTLEDWVDGQVCSDTLYVVIGAYFDQYTDPRGTSASPKKISFGGRSDVSCPTMYYYILMRTKKGNSGKSLSQCSASEIQCAAFVRSHKTPKGTKVSSADLMSVSDLEKVTGFTYFPNVPHAPKDSYKASDWGL